jgi:uncharacterized protein (DUF305 family)
MKALYAIIGIIVGLVIGIAIPRPARVVEVPAPHDMSTMSMSDSMYSMNGSIAGKTGDAFDSAFLENMIVHHEGAVGMARQVLNTSKRPELIALANAIISAQEKEITQMKVWQRLWFGN